MKKMCGKLIAMMLIAMMCFAAWAPQTAEAATVINVTSKKYGAKAGTDSTTAIQKALDDATKKGTSKKAVTVKIPKGTYYISKTLYIGSNTKLQLAKGTTIKKAKGAKVLYMLSSKPGKKGGYNGSSNISVSGGKWDAEFRICVDKSGGSIFFFAHAKNIVIQNVELMNCYSSHLIELGGVKSVTIENCKLHGFKGASKSSIKEAIQIDITHDEEILPHGEPYDDTPCADITICGNTISDYPRGIGSHISIDGIYQEGILIENNSLKNIDAAAVYAYGYTGLAVKDNEISNVGIGISIRDGEMGDSNTIFARNKGVKAMKKSDIANIIDNNVITNTKEEGIAVYATKAEGAENTVKSTGGNAVTVSYGAELSLSDTSIANASAIAVSVTNDSKVALSGCELSGAKKMGLYVGAGCSAALVDTSVKKNGSHNICVDGGNMTANGLTDEASATNGITVMNGATVDIADSLITNATKKGISVTKKSTIVVRGTTISDNLNDSGIYADADCTLTVTGCRITGNGKFPISCKGAKLKEENNTCESNGNDKIIN